MENNTISFWELPLTRPFHSTVSFLNISVEKRFSFSPIIQNLFYFKGNDKQRKQISWKVSQVSSWSAKTRINIHNKKQFLCRVKGKSIPKLLDFFFCLLHPLVPLKTQGTPCGCFWSVNDHRTGYSKRDPYPWPAGFRMKSERLNWLLGVEWNGNGVGEG